MKVGTLDPTSPNWELFFTAWMIVSVIVAVATLPTSLPGLLVTLAARAAIRTVTRWIATSTLKATVPAYLIACVQIGGGGGDTGAMLPTVAEMGTSVPAIVAIHFDGALFSENRIHAKIDDQLIEEVTVDRFASELGLKLLDLGNSGCKEAILHLNPYPGLDIHNRIRALCREAGIKVTESDSAWGSEPPPIPAESGQ
jgi:hypothetical protein